jgi:probable phosphoglycerate mutase
MTFTWPELYFVRHGQTDWNAEGRYRVQGHPAQRHRPRPADKNGALLHDLLRALP